MSILRVGDKLSGTNAQLQINSATNKMEWSADGNTWNQVLMSGGGSVVSAELWVNGAYTGEDSDGTLEKPFKTIAAAAAGITKPSAIHLAPGIYTEAASVTFPAHSIILFGNKATLNITGGLFVYTGSVVQDLTVASSEALSCAGAIFIRCTISAPAVSALSDTSFYDSAITGDVTVSATKAFAARNSTFSGRIIAAGNTCFLVDCVVVASSADPAVASTAGVLWLNNVTVANNGAGGAISCDNGASAVPNRLDGVYCPAGGITCGNSATLINAGLHVAGSVTGTAMQSGKIFMALGSDATGDLYCRNSDGYLARIPIADAAGKLLAVNEDKTGYVWITPPTGGSGMDLSSYGATYNGHYARFSYASGGIDEYVIACLHFDDDVTDSAAHWGTPTVEGTQNYVTGKFSKAFHFDASSGYGPVIYPYNASYFDFADNQKLTFEFRIRTTDTSDISDGKFVFAHAGDGTTKDTRFYIYFNGGSLLFRTARNDASPSSKDVNMGAVADGSWHHCAITYDGAGTIRAWLDGELLSTESYSMMSSGQYGSDGFAFGANHFGTPGVGGIFDLDEVRLSLCVERYTASFTPAVAPFSSETVRAIYVDSEPLSAITSPLVSAGTVVSSGGLAKWILNNSLNDSFGSHTLTNSGVAFSTDSAFPLGSRYVGIFNGSSYASFDTTGLPSGSGTWSISAWIKTTATSTGYILSFGEDIGGRAVAPHVSTTFVLDYDSGHVDSGISVNDGNWHFVVATYDGSVLRTFVDNVAGGYATVGLDVSASGAGRVGRCYGGYDYYFTGSISDARVYNRALSTSEIQAIYEGEASATSGLMSATDKTKLDSLSPDTVASSETTVTTSYTADWDTATIHRIKTTASTACALTVQDIPLGEALVIRVDNTAAGSVTFGTSTLVTTSDTSVKFLTFTSVTGTIEPVQ